MAAVLQDYRSGYVAASVLFMLWQQYLRLRTRARLASPEVSPAVRAAIPDLDDQEHARAAAYSRDKNTAALMMEPISGALGLISLWLSPVLWNGSTLVVLSTLGLSKDYELVRMLVHLVLVSPWSLATSLPFSAYRTFVIEARYGFNKHTVKSWLSDSLKMFFIEELVLNACMLGPLTLILRRMGTSAWFYLWAFLSAFVVLLNMLWPIVIAPLFNTFKPLEDGPVRQGIEALITQSGIACSCVYEVDGSKQSTHSNAYVAGVLKTKRIVVYDTLIKDLDEKVDDICAVVAHEIGHSKLHHNVVLMLVMCGQFFVLFWTFGFCQSDPRLVTDFGFDEPGTYLTLSTFLLCYSALVQPIFAIVFNAITRHLEFAADRYSVDLGFDIRASLAKISKTNLQNLNPDPLVSMCNDSHPTPVQRLEAVKKLLDEAARVTSCTPGEREGTPPRRSKKTD